MSKSRNINNDKQENKSPRSEKENFIKLLIKEWINGWAKLFGWLIPIAILTFILRPITDISLRIDDIKPVVVSDKSVLSPDNTEIEGGEFRIENQKAIREPVEKQKPVIHFELSGKGKIDKAFYFYRLDQYDDEEMNSIKYEFDINSNLFKDFFQRICITPSKIELPTNLNIRTHEGEYSRSYLALRDANSEAEYKFFLVYIKKSNSIGEYDIEIISEKEINQTAPNTYKIDKGDKLANDIEDIQKELLEIKSLISK